MPIQESKSQKLPPIIFWDLLMSLVLLSAQEKILLIDGNCRLQLLVILDSCLILIDVIITLLS